MKDECQEVQLTLFGAPPVPQKTEDLPRRIGPPAPPLPTDNEPDLDPDTGYLMY